MVCLSQADIVSILSVTLRALVGTGLCFKRSWSLQGQVHDPLSCLCPAAAPPGFFSSAQSKLLPFLPRVYPSSLGQAGLPSAAPGARMSQGDAGPSQGTSSQEASPGGTSCLAARCLTPLTSALQGRIPASAQGRLRL